MSDITKLGSLVLGVERNIDLTANTLVTLSVKVGGGVTNTELTKAILDRLVSLQNGTDVDGTYHTHNTLYYTHAQLNAHAGGGGSGADLIGDGNTYINISPSTTTVESALAALDAAVGGASTALDGTFRIENTSDNTKKIAFSASGISTGQTRTITMPDANVDLGNLTNSNISASAAIAYSKLNLSASIVNADIATGANIALAKLAALTNNRAVATNGSGVLVASATTDTELGYVSGVTSAIQTQLSHKIQDNGSVAFTANQPMGGFKLTGLAAGSGAGDSVRYEQAILASGANAFAANQSFGGFQANNLADPTSPQDAATKNYVDTLAQGIAWKAPVRAVSTSNITLSGAQTIDGVSLIAGDRVLVAGQTTTTDNGIYVVASSAWARAADASTGAELVAAAVFVDEGTTNALTSWVQQTAAPITIGTTAITFAKFASATPYVFRNGLTQTGQNVDVTPGDNSLLATSGSLVVQLDGSGALVTGGSGIKAQTDGTSLDINGSNQLEIKANGVSNAKLAQMVNNTVKGNKSGSTGNATDLALSSVTETGSAILTITNGSNAIVGASNLTIQVQQASGSASGYLSSTDWTTFNNKLSTALTNQFIFVGNASNVATGVAVSGDLTVANTGAFTIASSAVTLSKIASNAVDENKIVSTAFSTTGAITGGSGTKIAVNVDGTSLDINGSNQVEIKAAGVTSAKVATGVFDQATITGGAGTPAAVASAPAIIKSFVAGQSFTANTTYMVRWGIPSLSETAGRVYAADYDSTSNDKFWVIGLFNSGTSVTAGNTISVVIEGPLTLGSSDTAFASGDQGFPVWLGASGAYLPNSSVPTTSKQANFKGGMAQSSTVLWVDRQMMGVN